jgi:PhzF family phenazine biosynthesis protein
MAPNFFHVDAFTDQPFRGNPAAVLLLDSERPTEWMQSFAADMNLSETSFVVRRESGFGLRWCTPAVEVDLCGHATLASAHVLLEQGVAGAAESIEFHTRGGILKATRGADRIELDFPAKPAEAVTGPAGLFEALGAPGISVGRNQFDYLIELESDRVVRGLKPDFGALGRIQGRGFIVTARSDDPRYHFVSRFFAPGVGINEDPVTGSAHCCLAPFWAERLGRTEMLGYQASKRGGEVGVRLAAGRVFLLGRAITLVSGHAALD